MRRALLVSLFCAACGPKFYPPIIAGVNYEPTTAKVNVGTTIAGSVNFTDSESNVTEIVTGVVDVTGNLIENIPEFTGTDGLPAGTITFGIPFLGAVAGTEQIEVRLLDITGLSSEPSFQPVMVE